MVTITGPDRLTWLHALTTQYFEGLKPGTSTTALLLSPTGHIEHAMYGVDDGETFWLHTEPGAAAALVEWLQKMVFMSRVEITDVTEDYAIVWRPGDASAEDPDAVAARIRSAGTRCSCRGPSWPRSRARGRRPGLGVRGAEDRGGQLRGSGSTRTSGRSRTSSAGSASAYT